MLKTLMIAWDPRVKTQSPSSRPAGFRANAFIQARTGSTRLPNKIYRQIAGVPMLYHVIDRARQAKFLDDVVVISPQTLPNLPDAVSEWVWDQDERDVLSRYRWALDWFPCDYVVRLTSDCPMLDPQLIDAIVAASIGHDYGTNVISNTFPDGTDVEVISADTLKWLHETVTDKSEREHVTTYIRNRPEVQCRLSIVSLESTKDWSHLKLSVDTEQDLTFVDELSRCLAEK